MATLTLRLVKGSTLTFSETDNNFTALNDEKIERDGSIPFTGAQRFIAGTVSAPGITIVGDTNTGVYSPAADQLAISCGGSQIGLFSSVGLTVNGNGGIGFTVNGVSSYYAADIIGQPDGVNNAYTFRAKGNTTNNVLATIENTSATGSANLWIAANNFNARIRMLCSPSVGLIGTETSHNLYLRTNWADRISISASGNVTIFAPSSGTTLYVYGDIYATGTITQGSDARMKTDVQTINSALDKVSAIRGVSFTRIDTGKRDIGVIAQEVVQVLPEVVHKMEGGNLGVAYGSMVGIIIEALKELRNEVEAIKDEVLQLKNKS
jgi:hypothetical protein